MKTSRVTIESFYHSLIIDTVKTGFLIYNDRNGEHMILPFVLIDRLLRGEPKKLDACEVLRLFVKFFSYEKLFNDNVIVTILGSITLENIFYRMKSDLDRVLCINNYSEFSLLSESLFHAQK